MITLQKELIKTQESEARKYVEPSTSDHFGTLPYKDQKRISQLKIWKVGDKCMAKDATNGQYYEATIESISDDGEAQLVFEAYQNRGQSHVRELREHKVRVEVFASGSNKRPIRPNQKEYLKKKKQKKQARMAELEEEREKEKNKWLNFNNKAAKKTMVKTQSIFQSPDTPSGRVGIGTLKTNPNDVPLPNNFQTARLDIHKRKM